MLLHCGYFTFLTNIHLAAPTDVPTALNMYPNAACRPEKEVSSIACIYFCHLVFVNVEAVEGEVSV